MNTGHPRDVDPSNTGQPHQVTGKAPDLMGISRGRLVTRCSCQRRYENSYRRITFPAVRCRAARDATPLRDVTPLHDAHRTATPRPHGHAAPRCSASHTAIDSRAPSSTALPQWAIQAATPSGVPETYPSRASRYASRPSSA